MRRTERDSMSKCRFNVWASFLAILFLCGHVRQLYGQVTYYTAQGGTQLFAKGGGFEVQFSRTCLGAMIDATYGGTHALLQTVGTNFEHILHVNALPSTAFDGQYVPANSVWLSYRMWPRITPDYP